MEYKLFKTTYTDRKTGKQRQSDTYHIGFRDHLNARQSIAGTARESETRKLAEKVAELVDRRRDGSPLGERLLRWLEVQPEKFLARIAELELVDPRAESAGKPLVEHLVGTTDENAAMVEPGYKQALEARGNTVMHVTATIGRIQRLLEGCGLVFWKDLIAPGVTTNVEVWLGERRESGQIRGKSFNYYVRDLRGFCRWLKKTDRAPAVAMTELVGVDNAESDSDLRRSLSVDEMKWLLSATVDGPMIQRLAGDERAILYRFAFESGIRPGQIRALKVQDFDLESDLPIVTAHARFVKRRKVHVQALRASLAAELRGRFATKMPDAAAFKMPSRYHMADMLRADLAAARKAWLEEQGLTHKQREERHRSDFLNAVNNAGERAVFYSTRHGHGTALANAGVPEKDIAASMHHASRVTTARYLHADRAAVAKAVAVLPDLTYSPKHVATGTT